MWSMSATVLVKVKQRNTMSLRRRSRNCARPDRRFAAVATRSIRDQVGARQVSIISRLRAGAHHTPSCLVVTISAVGSDRGARGDCV